MADTVKAELRRLIDAGQAKKLPLSAPTPAPPIGESVGFVPPPSRPGQSPGLGGGLVPPFTEPDAAARVYWPAQDIFTEDGTLVKIRPIKYLRMVDAAGVEIPQNFALPDYASIA